MTTPPTAEELAAWRECLADGVDLYAEDQVRLIAEVERLSEELDAWATERAAILDELTHGDERHCTCVPALRAEVERLRAALDQIASWGEGATVNGTFDEPGSAGLARAALRGEDGASG